MSKETRLGVVLVVVTAPLWLVAGGLALAAVRIAARLLFAV